MLKDQSPYAIAESITSYHCFCNFQNLPFNINNRKLLTWNLFWYVGTGLAAPFLIVELQLRKK